jgi:hypothetical protein
MKPAKWGVLGAILVLLLTIGGEAQADHATEMKAREAFAAGRYDQALDLFAKLYAETLHPVYLRNIGRCHQKMREPQKAIDAFKDYLQKSKKIPADERAEVEGYIKEMEALRDEQVKAAVPPPPPTPPPGPVTPLPPAVPPTTTAPPPAATPSASATLVSEPPPAQHEPAPFYKKWWFWTAVGVVAAGTVAAILLIPGGVERPDCKASGADICL